MKKYEYFYEWMSDVRSGRGWSETDCAERAGMTQAQWYRLEHGQPLRDDGTPSQPTYKTVLRVADALFASREEACSVAGYMLKPGDAFSDAEMQDDLPDQEFLGYMGRKLVSIPEGPLRREWKRKLRVDAEATERMLLRICEENAIYQVREKQDGNHNHTRHKVA